MKKLSLLMLLIMSISILTGCGQSSETNTKDITVSDQKIEKTTVASTINNILSTELFGDENALQINLDNEQLLVNITSPGTYALSGKLEGQVVVDVTNDEKVKLILNGAEIINDSGACIYVKNADKVIISSNKDSVNILSATGKFANTENSNIDAAIFSHDDLNINGDGTIVVSCTYGHGIVSKDALKIKNGTVNITSYKKGISGKDSVEIEDGNVQISCGTNALDSEGDITVSGGTVSLYSNKKDGIHTDGNVLISGGSVYVLNSKEGIEGLTVTISGGEVSIVSSDDGINSSGNSDSVNNWQIGSNPFLVDDGADITITDGILKIDAGGDGIDSNGTLNVSGGELYISGSVTDADSAIDYASNAVISGGTIVAAGSQGMAEGFGSDSTQANILYNFGKDYDANTEISVLNSSGDVLISYCPPKTFSSVVISSPDFETGESYSIIVAEDTYSVQLESVCFSNSNGFGHMGQMGQMGPGPKMDGMPGGNPWGQNGEPPARP